MAMLLAKFPGVHAISYSDPTYGPHVVACYVRPEDRVMFFTERPQRDVEVPFPESADWLTAYFDIFAKICTDLFVTSFAPVWNTSQASQAYQACDRDAKLYPKN